MSTGTNQNEMIWIISKLYENSQNGITFYNLGSDNDMKIDDAGNSSQDESSKEDGATSCDVDKEKLDKTAESVEEGIWKIPFLYCILHQGSSIEVILLLNVFFSRIILSYFTGS